MSQSLQKTFQMCIRDRTSSVTLYGLVDLGTTYERKDGASSLRQKSGNQSGSRWGLRGSEDLGNGCLLYTSANAIAAEATLSFLGIGLPVTCLLYTSRCV